MYKQITREIESLYKLKRGIDELADTVKVTLGPKGRPVIIETSYGDSILTKDGVTVAQNITLKDPIENQGARLVKNVASKTNDVSGDGTTTATILAQALVTEGLKLLSGGTNGQTLKKGLDRALSAVIGALKASSKEITDDELVNVATISANDAEIGKIVAEAMIKVGKNGALTVEDAHASGMVTEIVDGLRFERGYITPYFAVGQENNTVRLDNPLIFITDKGINDEQVIFEVVERAMEKGKRDLLIIADTVEDSALGVLVAAYMQGKVRVCVVKAPGFANHKKELLLDIASLTGGDVISDDSGKQFKDIVFDDYGSAEKVIITKDHTTIIGGKAPKEKLEARITQLKAEQEAMPSDFEKERYRERIAKLSGGIGVIKVGANTELEAKEKKHRVEDAIRATSAAREEGIVAGGGVALLRAVKTADYTGLDGSDAIGANVLARAVEEPLRCIANNAGYDGTYVVRKVQELNGNMGFDAMNGKIVEDMIAAGIVDPLKVTRLALENAVSIAGGILSSGAVITTIKDEKSAQ